MNTLEKYLLYAITGLTVFFSPMADSLWFVGSLVIADFISGIAKARKLEETITSHRMIDKWYASVGYFIGMIIAYVVEKKLGGQVPLLAAGVSLIAISELQSIRENIKVMSGVDILKPVTQIFKRKDNGTNSSDEFNRSEGL